MIPVYHCQRDSHRGSMAGSRTITIAFHRSRNRKTIYLTNDDRRSKTPNNPSVPPGNFSTRRCCLPGNEPNRHSCKQLRQLPTTRLPLSKLIQERCDTTTHMQFSWNSSRLFPYPPKAWQCCGCMEEFYNFEKECTFCAAIYCNDCKMIPWR